jgi:hypothetical protein
MFNDAIPIALGLPKGKAQEFVVGIQPESKPQLRKHRRVDGLGGWTPEDFF